ncbi:MAG: hypothetical protein LBP50_09530 [Tannerella sp.]|jgi:hypothetical protein|nr:hypothetical protein [Tannerella sp.]
MASTVTLGLAEIKVGAIDADGGMGTSLSRLGYTFQNTAQMQQEDGTTTDFIVEELDTPLASITQPGKLSFNFSIADPDVDTLAKIFGGTADTTSTPNTWSAPDASPELELSIEIVPKQGLKFKIPRAKVTAKFNGSFSKTSLFLVEVSCVVLQPVKAGEPRITVTKL